MVDSAALGAFFEMLKGFVDRVKSIFSVLKTLSLSEFLVGGCVFVRLQVNSEQMRAVAADEAQNFADVLQHVSMVNWHLQLDAAEVTRAVGLGA